MPKAEAQYQQTQRQPAEQRTNKGMAVESPQSERIAQFELMAENSPQAREQMQLAATIDASSRMAAQRRIADVIHNSPRQVAQRKVAESLNNSPHVPVQRQMLGGAFADETKQEDAEEPLQAEVAQREEAPAKPNNTGLPDKLKSGIESLSGMSIDNVRVHYNSPLPAQLNAHAYAQGTDIHVASGQEKHLPHEAWHVVQQAQGRVRPTMQMKGSVPINDDKSLEHEADVMGCEALQTTQKQKARPDPIPSAQQKQLIQKKEGDTGLPGNLKAGIENLSGCSLDDVKAHYYPDKPAQLKAHFFAQCTNINLACGQENNLPHEEGYVVQQKQERVRPTLQMEGKVSISDGGELENEADVMGEGFHQFGAGNFVQFKTSVLNAHSNGIVQRNLVRDQDVLDQRGATFSWTPFRGKRHEEDISKTGIENGRGTELDGVYFGGGIKSKITWSPVDPVAKEGTAMTAAIGPDHNLGSSPSVDNALGRVEVFKTLSGKSYVSGHLLNEKLGGPGNDARNLTAFSGTANSTEASNIEKKVRDPVNNEGAWFHYSIDIEYQDNYKDYLSTDPRVTKLPLNLPCGVKRETLLGGNIRILVRYASKLKAHWYQYNTKGGRYSAEYKKDINMDSPLDGGTATLDDKNGPVNIQPNIFNRGDAAKTAIKPEELVLTTSTLLKSVVENREGLIGLLKDLRGDIGQLKKTVMSLEEQAKENEGYIDKLNRLLYGSGYDWGYADGQSAFEDEVSRYEYYVPGLTGAYGEGYETGYEKGFVETRQYHWGRADGKNSTDDDKNYHGWGNGEYAYRQGHKDGVQEKKGYNSGYKAGYEDLMYFCFGFNEPYEAGYKEGYNAGYSRSPFRTGNRPVFDGITLAYDESAISGNILESFRGMTSVEITGKKYFGWYQVKIVSSEASQLSNAFGSVGWMKKSWIWKGW